MKTGKASCYEPLMKVCIFSEESWKILVLADYVKVRSIYCYSALLCVDPQPMHMLGKSSTTEIHSQPMKSIFLKIYFLI